MMESGNDERIVRYVSGEGDRDEREAFEKDLESDSVLKEQFLNVQTIWKNVPNISGEYWGSERAWQKFEVSTRPILNVRTRRITTKFLWPVAALLVLSLGTFILFWNLNKPVAYAYNSDQTGPVILSDGSKIYLNKNASLKVFPFTKGKRRVSLIGEAYFEISPDAKRPFTVESGNTFTEVVGTAFNITQESDHTAIFVSKGKVIFRSKKNENAALALTAGEAADFKNDRMQMIPNPSPNINAWHTRQLSFINIPLSTVVTDVSDYFNQNITIENENVRNCRIYITFKEPEIQSVLNAVASFINGTLKIQGDRYIIQGGKCP